MKHTYTPGPWTAKLDKFSFGNQGERYVIHDEAHEHKQVCIVAAQAPRKRKTEYDAPDAERDANALLIAHAPELLEALQRIISELPAKRDWLDPDLEKYARDIIQKSTAD